eukprot:jgi/Phyca11/22059/fgenesh1_pg.PHYCAscaffold_552_\
MAKLVPGFRPGMSLDDFATAVSTAGVRGAMNDALMVGYGKLKSLYYFRDNSAFSLNDPTKTEILTVGIEYSISSLVDVNAQPCGGLAADIGAAGEVSGLFVSLAVVQRQYW